MHLEFTRLDLPGQYAVCTIVERFQGYLQVDNSADEDPIVAQT